MCVKTVEGVAVPVHYEMWGYNHLLSILVHVDLTFLFVDRLTSTRCG
jgi:hypothetical protein